MFWIKSQETERRLTQMNRILAASFANVKQDTQKIFSWLNYLNQQNQQQQQKIKQLELEISYIPKRPEDIRKIIDNYYSFDNIIERIRLLNEKIDNLHLKDQSKTLTAPKDVYDIEKRLSSLEEQRKATIREKVVQRVSKNSKEYVKSLILSYIRKYSQISGLQLKEMIVQDQGLCSKSSFYRLLDEIEKMEEIGTAKRGKQKYYLYKQVKAH
ncbi:hypothetical protein HYU09_04390 [Candidatus Woesearchaeota archaeon]|nr:hypothetical protein [Candidatus Woesearchaeota archaeon]